MIGITLFLLAIIEGLFSVGYLIKDRTETSLHPRSQADCYRTVSWVRDYFREAHESFAARWEPYVYWRSKPYKGQYININAAGIRLTTDLRTDPGKNHRPLKVFMFGGSTMWGTGVRDAYTIPSLVARELRNLGTGIDITNFGENGHVSTQEVISLWLQLRDGNVPDLVIFYDGANDTFSTYQQGTAGIPQSEYHRVEEFNILNSKRHHDLKRIAVKEIIRNLSTVRFFRFVRESIGDFMKGLFSGPRGQSVKSMKRRPASEGPRPEEEERRLAEKTVEVYLANIAMAKSLAASYGFKCLFYWQPTILYKQNLSGYERNERDTRHVQQFKGLFDKTYDIIGKSGILRKDKAFRNLGTIFSDVKEPVFIDWCHLSEAGNAVIAHEMAKGIRPLAMSVAR